MNYLLIGGADSASKNEVVRLYAQKLSESADFDLVSNRVPGEPGHPFHCIFTNRITQKSVFINNEPLSATLFTDITHFKENYPPGDTIVTVIPSPDAPSRHTLMERFDVLPSDQAVEISLDNLPEGDASHLKHAADEIEDMLTKAPFNLL